MKSKNFLMMTAVTIVITNLITYSLSKDIFYWKGFNDGQHDGLASMVYDVERSISGTRKNIEFLGNDTSRRSDLEVSRTQLMKELAALRKTVYLAAEASKMLEDAVSNQQINPVTTTYVSQ